MGYDMYIETELTDAEALAKQAADDQFDAAVQERGKLERNTPEWEAAQERVIAAADETHKHNLNYFRLNIWGMQRCRQAMYETGMVYDSSYSECPQFPDYTPPTSAEGGAEALEKAEAEYEAEHEKAALVTQQFHPDGGETIPVHKLCDNSGWHVTEEECKGALAAWKTYDEARTKQDRLAVVDEDGEADDSVESTINGQWWPEWIAFLERAATRGGFRVY